MPTQNLAGHIKQTCDSTLHSHNFDPTTLAHDSLADLRCDLGLALAVIHGVQGLRLSVGQLSVECNTGRFA